MTQQTIHPETATILVVEDNPDNLFIVLELLRGKTKVQNAHGRATGKQLFKLLQDTPELCPDLILLDIQIPYEDGYVILGQLREDPRYNKTKIIAVTANVMHSDVTRARTAGFDGFIGKPIHASRFPDQVRKILAGEPIWEPR